MADVKKIDGYIIKDDISRTNIGCTQDTYDNSKTYAIDDVVVYNNTIFKCITAVTAAENFNSAKWQQICLRDLLLESRVRVSPTQPTTNEKVWIQKGKNLVDKYFSHLAIDGIGKAYKDDYCVATDFITITPNTDYVCSNSMNISAGGVFVYDKNKNFLEKTYADAVLSVINTSNKEAKYIRIVLWNPSIDNLQWIQLEEGSTVTDYEAYVERKIYVKNDNGVYEEFLDVEKVNNNMNYSTEEQVIGTYMGKPVYRRIITGTTPTTNKEWNRIGLGILNLKNIINYDFYFKNTYNSKYKAPYYENFNGSEYYVLLCISDIEAGAENTGVMSIMQNNFPDCPYSLYIEYTKTTD